MQLLEQLLYKIENDRLIYYRNETPNKNGFDPKFGGCEQLLAKFAEPYSWDATQWDWTAPEWVFWLCYHHRRNMCLNKDETWQRLHWICYAKTFLCKNVILSSGLVFTQIDNGLQPSGRVNTLSDNGYMGDGQHVTAITMLQEAGHRVCLGIQHVACLGDDRFLDKIGPFKEEYIKANTELGIIVKECEQSNDFAGIDLKTRVPSYWEKHCARVFNQVDEFLPETLSSYMRYYVWDDKKFSFFHDWLLEVAPERVVSQSKLRRWWKGFSY